MFIAQRLRIAIPISILLMLLSIGTVAAVQLCLFPNIVETVRQMCSGLNNEACIGATPILMQDTNGQPLTTEQGTRHLLNTIGLIEPQSPESVVPFNWIWGGQGISGVIAGNVRTRDEVPTGAVSTPSTRLTAIIRTGDGSNANLRGAPSTSGAVETAIPSGATVTIYERTSNNEWALLSYETDERIVYGWVAMVLLDIDPSIIPITTTTDDPWQSFSLTGSGEAPSCNNVPYGGVLLQSPDGSTVNFRVNGVLVYMGSTTMIRPLANGGIRIISIEGNVAVRDSSNMVVNIAVGHYVDILNGVFVSTKTIQISYRDGQGLDVLFTMLNVRVFLPVPPLTSSSQFIDVFLCETEQVGPGGTVYARSDEPVVLKVGYVESLATLQQLRTRTSEVTVNDVSLPIWGVSPIQRWDPAWGVCNDQTSDAGNGVQCPLDDSPDAKTHFYNAYSVLPPQQPGSYVVQWYNYQCTIIVQQPTAQSTRITLDARNLWQNTGIQLRSGQVFSVTASGSIRLGTNGSDIAPVGGGYEAWQICPNTAGASEPCALNGAPYGLLIGRIGNDVFRIGAGQSLTASASGTLELAVNDNLPHYSDNSGEFTVDVTYSP